MKTGALIFLLILLAIRPAESATDPRLDAIFTALAGGEVEKATELFRQLPPQATRDADLLFINSLLEADGATAWSLLRTALAAGLDGKYAEEARFRMIQMAEAAGDSGEVLTQGEQFLQHWENSRYRETILAAMAAYEPSGGEEEKRYLDLVIEESPASWQAQSARLIKAQAAYDRGQYKTAEKLCREISNQASDELAPSGLILLARLGLKNNQPEKALLNYNILREQYPRAIGQDQLIEALKRVSEAQSAEESTEVFEGLVYSVQVGVFSVKDNARSMADRIKAYGYKTRIQNKQISGRKYFVVLAGSFTTLQAAQTAREKLELAENEPFKVVVDDDK